MQYLILILVTVGCDQVSKMWVMNSFKLYDSQEVIPGFLNLVYVTNRGAAFSLLADIDSPWRHYFFLVVGVSALIVMTIIWFRLRKDEPWQAVAIVLIAAGALGNLIDRVRFGAVIDFIDIYSGSYHWPAFNIADSAICTGVAFLILFSFFDKNKRTTTEVK